MGRAGGLVFFAMTTFGTAAALGQVVEPRPAPAAGGPSVISQGSGNVSVGGQGAVRQGDADDQASAVATGSSNVFINGRPAVTVGDRTNCGGVVVGGASNVFVNGKPLARTGDLTTGCPGK